MRVNYRVWRPIATVPEGENDRVLVYNPELNVVCEARASKNGDYCDPVYQEWFDTGATHWAPLPEPPQCGAPNQEYKS